LAKFVNYLKRGIVTVHGPIEVHRAYYCCLHCKQSSIPSFAGTTSPDWLEAQSGEVGSLIFCIRSRRRTR
jgi:hypothetical protein